MTEHMGVLIFPPNVDGVMTAVDFSKCLRAPQYKGEN